MSTSESAPQQAPVSQTTSATSAPQSTAPQSTAGTPPPSPAVAAQESEQEIEIGSFAKVNLRVATIEAVEAIPKSKKLYRLQIDLGPLGKRQIVSGIAQHYTPEQLIGQNIVVIANLKPTTLMGIESHGMLLAASCDDTSNGDNTISLLTPLRPIPAGARVR